MKKLMPGLIIGLVSATVIIVTQVIFPRFEEDSMWMVLLGYLLFFASLFLTGFSFKLRGEKGGGIRIGAVTGLLAFIIIMGTYFFIDNAFIGTVSKQTAKIWGFSGSGYKSMQEYLNLSLLKGLLYGIPLSAFLGGVFGGIGGVLAAFITRRGRRFPNALSLLTMFLPYAVVITLFTGMAYAVGQQTMRQGGNDPQVIIANDMVVSLENGASPYALKVQPVELSKSLSPFVTIYDADGKVIVSSAYLDGKLTDLPQGILPYVKVHGQDTFTWQPRRSVRQAVIVEKYEYKNRTGYVAVGRSLKEVESRIDRLGYQLLSGWVISLGTVFFALVVVELLHRSENRKA